MSNRYQTSSKTNPLPIKTCVPNCIGWTSLEEQIIYAMSRQTRQIGTKIVKMEINKEDT